MAQDPVDEDASASRPDAPSSRSNAEPDGLRPALRPIVVWSAVIVPCVVIALSVISVVRDTERRGTTTPAVSGVGSPQAMDSAVGATLASPSNAPPVESAETAPTEFVDETDDGEPSPVKRSPPKQYSTVQQAAVESCSTASVEGLSRQIIEQSRCIEPNAFVPLPTRPNLMLAANVFPYLELGARDHLLRALDARASEKMTINSALRTVAQQYLVSRWSTVKRCGVQLATAPGESNHEMGAALDIAEPAHWRTALEAQAFHWLGTSDRVHFDYKASEGSRHTSVDVLAFQMLWNRNHPTDAIASDGRYSPATEQRLKKAPANGFPIGSTCRKEAVSKRP